MAESDCVVCFKNVKIYSIGECDHPVCYECSTRMRVICAQNECPICRKELTEVLFVKKVRPFRRTLRDRYLYDSKYNILFENDQIKQAYNDLLRYVCNKCNDKPKFKTSSDLNEHMKHFHDLYSCELCTNYLKIFPIERRYYTKHELQRHRRIGDIDDKSYKGHPLCEFCNVRYMDRDELYKHLRKSHFYCHICDSEGIQQFYGSYISLRLHHKSDHYLCEEGDCSKEELTNVFLTEIDLKAHKASVHCKNLRDKHVVKQIRTLDLPFNLVPRNLSRNDHLQASISHSAESIQHQAQNVNVENILASWDAAFPSLTNTSYTIPKPKIVRASNNTLEVTDENFPPLGIDQQSCSSSSTFPNTPIRASHSKSHASLNTKSQLPKNKSKKTNIEAQNSTQSKSSSSSSPPPSSFSLQNFPVLQNSIAENKNKNSGQDEVQNINTYKYRVTNCKKNKTKKFQSRVL